MYTPWLVWVWFGCVGVCTHTQWMSRAISLCQHVRIQWNKVWLAWISITYKCEVAPAIPMFKSSSDVVHEWHMFGVGLICGCWGGVHTLSGCQGPQVGANMLGCNETTFVWLEIQVLTIGKWHLHFPCSNQVQMWCLCSKVKWVWLSGVGWCTHTHWLPGAISWCQHAGI